MRGQFQDEHKAEMEMVPRCGFESTRLKHHRDELAIVASKTVWYVPFSLSCYSPYDRVSLSFVVQVSNSLL